MAKLIVANWKMNPSVENEAQKIFESVLKDASLEVQTVIAPPFIYLSKISEIKKSRYIALGSQDLFWEESGAYTGEISPKQLTAFGVKYAILGHSERRINLGETDEMVSRKVKAAVRNNIIPILCVGETDNERKTGLKEKVLSRELKTGLSLLAGSEEIVIAYEPIWAIGTGLADTPTDTIQTFNFIKQILLQMSKNYKTQYIYGGSVNSENIENFIKHPEIEGVLVGRASLSTHEFSKILEISAEYK